MANTVFKLRRSSVAGKVPTTSDIAIGEQALNLTDRILYSSDGTNIWQIGANNTTVNVTNSITVATNSITNSSGIFTNSVNAASYKVGTAAFVANTSGVYTNNNINLTNNDRGITFTPLAGGANVGFRQQSDDNFVFYSTNTTNGQRAIFNVYANTNSNTQAGAFRLNTSLDMNNYGIYANGITGSAGQVLASNGSATYWTTVTGTGTVTSVGSGTGLTGGPITGSGTLSVNTGYSFSWSNTHTFQANVSFSDDIGIASNNAIYFGGLGDANWRMARNSNILTKWVYTNNTIDIVTANSTNEGFAIGLVSNSTYFETGYLGTYIVNKVTVGSSTSNATINSSAITANSITIGSPNSATFTNINGQVNASPGNFIANAYAYLSGYDSNYLAFGQQSNFHQWIQSGYSGNGAVYYSIILNPLGGNIGIGNTDPTDKLSVNGTTFLGGDVTLGSSGLSANGSYGSFGQSLLSNGSSTYWATAGATLNANNTDTETFYIGLSNASSGAWTNAVVSTTKLYYVPSTGTLDATVVNASSFTVGSTLIGNSIGPYGKTEGSLNVNSAVYANSSYTNSFTIGNSTYFLANGNIGIGNSATSYKLYVGGSSYTYLPNTSSNPAVSIVNDGSFYGLSITANSGQALYITSKRNGEGSIIDARTYSTPVFTVGANTATNTFVTIGTLTPQVGYQLTVNNAVYFANNLQIVGSVNSSSHTVGTAFTANATVVNAVSYYAGTTLIGNTTGPYGKTEINLNVNNSVTSNTATYLGNSSGTTANFVSWITGNSATAYTNAVSYTDGKILTANAAITGNAATAYTNAVSYVDGLKLDSVTNTSITLIPVANTVKNAYDRAIDANTRAASAQTAAASAYTNSVSYTDSKILTANAAITGNAATAYSNAITFASNASNINTGTLTEARLPYRMNQNVTTANDVTFGSLTLTGNLTVSGNVTVIGANNLSITDNFIYLNSNNTTQNIDVGIAGNYNSAGYAHTGVFRDASDGTWKVFDNYAPEPDANVNIDTTNTSFHLANFQANTLYLGNTSTNWLVSNTGGTYITGTVNAASHTVGTAFTANATVVNAVSYYAGTTLIGNTTGPYGKTEGSLNVNSATQATNATNLNSQPGSYYTNATNITTGTLPYAQLGSAVVNTSGSFTLAGNTTFSANVFITGSVVNAVLYTTGSPLTGTGGLYTNTTTLIVGNNTINTTITSAGLTVNGASVVNSSVINSASHTIGTTFIANTTGVYHTGTVNAASFTVSTSTIANSTGVYTGIINAASHTVGTSTIANATGVYTGIVNATTISTGSVNVINASGLTTTANVNIGAAGELIVTAGAGISANGGFGSAGQILTSNASSIYWSTITAGATLNANNTETGTFYFGMANTTSGTWSNAVVSTTKLSFVPSTGALTVNGTISATSKSFLIPHPTKPNMKLRYGSLEGPENGVYIRGRISGENFIEYPEYWSALVDIDSITVQLTPIGETVMPRVAGVLENGVLLSNDNRNIDCFYLIMAERKDVDKLIVEF